jgi:riboflavin transporter FmnP
MRGEVTDSHCMSVCNIHFTLNMYKTLKMEDNIYKYFTKNQHCSKLILFTGFPFGMIQTVAYSVKTVLIIGSKLQLIKQNFMEMFYSVQQRTNTE